MGTIGRHAVRRENSDTEAERIWMCALKRCRLSAEGLRGRLARIQGSSIGAQRFYQSALTLRVDQENIQKMRMLESHFERHPNREYPIQEAKSATDVVECESRSESSIGQQKEQKKSSKSRGLSQIVGDPA